MVDRGPDNDVSSTRIIASSGMILEIPERVFVLASHHEMESSVSRDEMRPTRPGINIVEPPSEDEQNQRPLFIPSRILPETLRHEVYREQHARQQLAYRGKLVPRVYSSITDQDQTLLWTSLGDLCSWHRSEPVSCSACTRSNSYRCESTKQMRSMES